MFKETYSNKSRVNGLLLLLLLLFRQYGIRVCPRP